MNKLGTIGIVIDIKTAVEIAEEVFTSRDNVETVLLIVTDDPEARKMFEIETLKRLNKEVHNFQLPLMRMYWGDIHYIFSSLKPDQLTSKLTGDEV